MTDKLNADKTFAVCYTKGNGGLNDLEWGDSGIRFQTPKVTSISYGAPARVLTAESCFGDVSSVTVADCIATPGGSTAHYNALLPRASDVTVTYGDPTYGTGMGSGKHIALVEHTQNLGSSGQMNNPCRDANAILSVISTSGTDDNRLHTGKITAAVGTQDIIIPQQHSVGAGVYNYLDPTKTFAVCYAEGDGSLSDTSWRDSYIRVRMQKIHTLTASGVAVTTIGTIGSSPSLEFRWTGSLGGEQWLKITDYTQNSNEPCDQNQAGQAAAAGVSTGAIESGVSSQMVTVDTSILTQGAANGAFFVVCYAEGLGNLADNTWTDSGIRLRFIRWTNYGKSRVASGAPVRLTFSINMGRFDSDYDKVVLLQGESTCANAPSVAATQALSQASNALARTFDYVCTTAGGANQATSSCDMDFDGALNEKCLVGSICDPTNPNNGGCGDSGTCEGTIQLPTGNSYDAVHDATAHTEAALDEGFYRICICLGTPTTVAPPTGYGGPNGDGGCNLASEYSSITSPVVPGKTVSVVSMPRLGRYLEDNTVTVRHISGVSHQYNIKASTAGAGYQVADGDKLFVSPAGLGCGHHTKYSGVGTHTYDHATNSYISTNVDRRWRTIAKTICLTIDVADVASNCDSNFDGQYTQTCTVGAFCDANNPLNGGCGTGGSCGTIIPAGNAVDRTALLSVTGYSATSLAGVVTTPSDVKLTTVGDYVTCFATSESLTGTTDVTDFVQLSNPMQVISPPRLGPISSPGHVWALEGSSPSFAVNTMSNGDKIYFVPKIQTTAANSAATSSDCAPNVCIGFGGSAIGTNCDTSYDGSYTDTCAYRSRCNPSNPNNGGCGTAGTCGISVPTVSTSIFTGLIGGNDFTGTSGKVTLPSGTTLMVPAYISAVTGRSLSAWHMAACFVPAGAISSETTNVEPLADMLTIIKEPTDAMIQSWYQYNVQELRFTQPQSGEYGTPTFATGQAGDIIVIKKDSCTDVHLIDPSTYTLGGLYSAKMVLEEAGGTTIGDEKGGTAAVYPLAQGKVNEMPSGVYKVCYATKMSEGEAQSDFKELALTVEIMDPPAMTPRLTVPRTVMLGQDVIIHWQANIGLQARTAPAGTWIGIYEKDACLAEDEWRHKCYKAFQFVGANEESGTVRFSQSDYKVGGEYDVRFFEGDSRNGQGEICRGLTGISGDTYVACMLEPKVTSSSIHIHGPDMRDLEDLDSQPGLEVVFAGNRGRFN